MQKGQEAKKANTQQRETELKELNARIDILESKVEKAATDAQVRYREQIAELKKKRNHLREKIDELRASGSEAWKDLKQGVEEAAKELRNALDAASKRFQ
jgi:uncharacterized coiled-coil DUF342 family protein